MAKTLIVSLGSTVMKDDAIGHHILDKLVEMNTNADMVKLDTDIFKLRLYYKKQKRVIIIDALMGDYHPGTVLTFNWKKLNKKLAAKIRSAHAIGSIEALKIMKSQNKQLQNADIYFVGVVVEEIDKGLKINESILKAIPQAIDEIASLII